MKIFYVILMAYTFVQCQSSQQNMSTENKKTDGQKVDFTLSEAEWKARLSPEEYYVLREKGTEAPYSGKYDIFFKDGMYTCKACGAELFSSDSKFDSHCGWPSFDAAVAKGTIIEQVDRSHGMTRTEILCANCGSHLGHVFNDGPTDTGLRYCVNSISLDFIPEDSIEKQTPKK